MNAKIIRKILATMVAAATVASTPGLVSAGKEQKHSSTKSKITEHKEDKKQKKKEMRKFNQKFVNLQAQSGDNLIKEIFQEINEINKNYSKLYQKNKIDETDNIINAMTRLKIDDKSSQDMAINDLITSMDNLKIKEALPNIKFFGPNDVIAFATKGIDDELRKASSKKDILIIFSKLSEGIAAYLKNKDVVCSVTQAVNKLIDQGSFKNFDEIDDFLLALAILQISAVSSGQNYETVKYIFNSLKLLVEKTNLVELVQNQDRGKDIFLTMMNTLCYCVENINGLRKNSDPESLKFVLEFINKNLLLNVKTHEPLKGSIGEIAYAVSKCATDRDSRERVAHYLNDVTWMIKFEDTEAKGDILPFINALSQCADGNEKIVFETIQFLKTRLGGKFSKEIWQKASILICRCADNAMLREDILNFIGKHGDFEEKSDMIKIINSKFMDQAKNQFLKLLSQSDRECFKNGDINYAMEKLSQLAREDASKKNDILNAITNLIDMKFFKNPSYSNAVSSALEVLDICADQQKSMSAVPAAVKTLIKQDISINEKSLLTLAKLLNKCAEYDDEFKDGLDTIKYLADEKNAFVNCGEDVVKNIKDALDKYTEYDPDCVKSVIESLNKFNSFAQNNELEELKNKLLSEYMDMDD